ncbi:IS110 family transposase [Arthrobacter sp. PAMC25284]|nr:IS110 family transposase [Arthrobacter sp. PAMC25284]
MLAANGEHLSTEAFTNTMQAGPARSPGPHGARTETLASCGSRASAATGAQLARQSGLAGYRAVEAARMGRAGRCGIGKSDPIDARRIAAAVLPLDEEQLRTPRMDEGSALAALAGVNPIPVSSGNTTRHRLNLGGDRRLNRALNVIAMVRMVHHPLPFL